MEFILYATAFRLGIIGAGTIFMYFGYRLFVIGVMPQKGTGLEGQAGEVRLTVKNAAPGTVFAIFGAALIGVMVWNGNPELRMERIGGEGRSSTVVVRGGGPNATLSSIDVERILSSKVDAETDIRRLANELNDPQLTLEAAAPTLLSLGVVYLRAGRNDEAIALTRLVYQILGDNPETLLLIARVEAARGDSKTALGSLERLGQVFPDMQGQAKALQRELGL